MKQTIAGYRHCHRQNWPLHSARRHFAFRPSGAADHATTIAGDDRSPLICASCEPYYYRDPRSGMERDYERQRRCKPGVKIN